MGRGTKSAEVRGPAAHWDLPTRLKKSRYCNRIHLELHQAAPHSERKMFENCLNFKSDVTPVNSAQHAHVYRHGRPVIALCRRDERGTRSDNEPGSLRTQRSLTAVSETALYFASQFRLVTSRGQRSVHIGMRTSSGQIDE